MGPVRTSLASFHVVVGLGVILACIMAVRGDTTQATPGEPATASSSLCPAGFACDNAGQITSACEVGKASALGQTSCHTCPDGYYADTIGMKACSECPAGYECPNQAYPPALCVAGTFSRGRTTACAPCPSLVGEDGRAAYCPPGSTATTLCPEGFFCTGVESAVEPQACPAGYYCPLGSFTPIICPVGAYCPANAVVPTACPKGTRRTNGARPGGATFAASCAVCPFGTYGRAAAEGAPVPATCADCAAGYVCRKGASSPTPEVLSRDGGNRCDQGFYCPAGAVPRACPAGTYNPVRGAIDETACLQCARGFFTSSAGQIACHACSASAVSTDDRTGCACIGAHRHWQTNTGLCLCKPRYQWFDLDLRLGAGDSKRDCQPIVYDRCTDGSTRDADGNCVNGTRYCAKYCRDVHDAAAGIMSSRTGHCECPQPTMDDVCDRACRATAPLAYIGIDGEYTVRASEGDGRVTLATARIDAGDGVGLGGALAGVRCENPIDPHGCPVVHIAVSSDGVATGYVNAALSIADGELLTADDVPQRRRLGASVAYNDSVAAAGIKQPLTCIVQGNSVIFAFTTSSWIVVIRDSMLNTWDSMVDFDPDGKFAALDAQCSLGKCPDSYKIKTGQRAGNYVFGFQFRIPGTFVFAVNNNLQRQFVVVVMPEGSTCPMGTYILPYTESNAVALGLQQDPTLIKTPDWALLGWMLGGLFGSVFVIVGLLYWLRSRVWQPGSDPLYRDRNKKMPMSRMHQKGSVLKTEEKEAASKFTSERMVEKPGSKVSNIALGGSIGGGFGTNGGDLDRWDADDLDPREILERMETNREFIVSKICGSDELITASTNQLLTALRQETEEVRRLVAETSFHDPDGTKAKNASLLKILENEITSRMTYDDRVEKLEAECIAGLQGVHQLFQNGVSEMVAKILEELEPSGDDRGHGQKRSKTVSALRTSVQQGARLIRKLVAAFERERERRLKGITLWNAAVQHGAVELDHDMTVQLEALRTLDEKSDVACRTLVATLRSFADGSDTFVMALGQTEIACATALRNAVEQQNPAELTKVKRMSGKQFSGLLSELKAALEKLGVRAATAKKTLTAARKGTKGQRKRLLMILEAQRAAEGHQDEDEDAFDGNGGIDAKHEHEKQKLDKEIQKEEEKHMQALENKLEAKAAVDIAHANETADAIQEMAKTQLADKGLSTKLQEKLMSQMNRDRDAMTQMMEDQRKRQAEAMKARLAERRIKRKNDLTRRHGAEKQEDSLVMDHQLTMKEIESRHVKETEAAAQQLQQEEKARVEEFMAQDADEEFQVGKLVDIKEVNRLEQQLQADLQKNGDAMDASRRADHERLLRKLELKKMQLQKKAEAQVAMIEANGRGDADAVQRIQEQYQHDLMNLKTHADAEKRRQQQALATRLKRHREAKMQSLLRKQEVEVHKMKQLHASDAGDLQDSLEEDDKLRQTIEDAKKDAAADDAVKEGKEELTSLVDEQQKMREAIENRHKQEQMRMEEEAEVEDMLTNLEDVQELELAELQLESDLQAMKGLIDENRKSQRAKLLEKLGKQKKIAKQRAAEVEKNQAILAASEADMDEKTKSAALAKVREQERRQKEMEAEISNGLQQLAADVLKFKQNTVDAHLKKREDLKDKLNAKLKAKEAAVAKEEALRSELEAKKAGLAEADRQAAEDVLLQAQSERRNLEKEVAAQTLKFEREAERVRSKMKDKRERQRDRMKEKLERKKWEAERLAAKKAKEEADLRHAIQLQAKQETERLAASGQHTEEAVRKLQNKLETEMLQQKSRQGREKVAQQERMKKRLEAKRLEKAMRLKRAQQAEMQDEVREQEKERHDVESDTSKKLEAKMLEGIMIRGADENRIDEAIEIVMHDRHAKEASDLLSEQYTERTSVLKEALEDLFSRKARERAALIDKLKAEAVDEAHIDKELAKMEDKYAILQTNVQMEATSTLDQKHAEAQLTLRQRQLAEVSHAFAELAPEDVLKKKQAEQAHRAEEELAEFKASMEREQQEHIAQIQAEKRKVEEDLRLKNEEEIRQMEREHAALLEKERNAADKKLQERKAKLLKEQEAQQAVNLQNMGQVSAQERAAMVKRFQEDRERVQAIVAAERDRQQRALEEKLRMRRMRRAFRQEVALRDRMKLEHARMQKRIEAVNATMNTALSAMSGIGMKAGRSSAHKLFSGAGSAVEMSVVSSMASKWKRHGQEKKAKAAEAMKLLENGNAEERRAARDAQKGIFGGKPSAAAEAARKEKEKKEALAQVESLQKKMQDELNKKGAEMTDRQRRQHERLVKKLELKKKKAEADALKHAKKAEEEKKKHIDEAIVKTEPILSGFGAIAAGDDTVTQTVEAGIEMPTYVVPKEKPQAPPGAPGGLDGGMMGTFDPTMEGKLLVKLNKLERLMERVLSSRGAGTSNVSVASAHDDDDIDYSNASLAERLHRYKAFQDNPQLIDFLHRVDG